MGVERAEVDAICFTSHFHLVYLDPPAGLLRPFPTKPGKIQLIPGHDGRLHTGDAILFFCSRCGNSHEKEPPDAGSSHVSPGARTGLEFTLGGIT